MNFIAFFRVFPVDNSVYVESSAASKLASTVPATEIASRLDAEHRTINKKTLRMDE